MKNIVYLLILMIIVSCKPETDKFRSSLNNDGRCYSRSIKEIPKELWKYKTAGVIMSSVVSDNEEVYFGSDDSCFYCLNKDTGIKKWHIKTGGKIRSTAILDGKYVYFLSYDGLLYKALRKTGAIVWSFNTEGESKHLIKDYYNYSKMVEDFWDFYQSSPLIYNGIIYFGCGNNFYAVNIENGDKLWSYKTEGVVHSSPAIKDDKIVFGSFDSRVYCLDAITGENNWTYETGRDTTYYIWLGVQASPAIEDEKVYIGSRDALIYCLDIHSGDTLWTNNNFHMSWMPSSFAIGNDLYCGSSDGFNLYVINKNTGKIKKQLKTNSYTFSSPALDSSMAYIGSANGRLYGIDLSKHEIVWDYKTEGCLTDTFKIYDENGIMNSDRYKEVIREQGINNYEKLVWFYNTSFKSIGAILSSPVIDDGIIYFGSADGYMYAIAQ